MGLGVAAVTAFRGGHDRCGVLVLWGTFRIRGWLRGSVLSYGGWGGVGCALSEDVVTVALQCEEGGIAVRPLIREGIIYP